MAERRPRHDQPIHLYPGILGACRPDTAGTGENLPGHQKRHERRETTPCERESARDQ